MVFRTSNHTADVALELQAASLAELLESCIQGMGALWLGAVPPADVTKQQLVWHLQAPSPSFLLVKLANEAIYQLEVNRHLAVAATVEAETAEDGCSCVAAVTVLQMDSTEAVVPAVQLKAATHGGLELRQEGGCWSCLLILDT